MFNKLGTFAFGDPSGSTFACVFFAGFSVAIGGLVYFISLRLLATGSLSHATSLRVRLASAGLGALVAFTVFLVIYFSSLAGFYEAEVRGEHLALHYILPERTVLLSLAEVAEVTRVPTFKGRWRLVIYTPFGQAYESAHASYASVREAWLALNQRVSKPTGRGVEKVFSSERR